LAKFSKYVIYIISLVGCVKPDKFAKNRFLSSDAPESISYSQSLKLVKYVIYIISLVGCVKPDKFAKNRFLLSDAPESISYSQSLKLVKYVIYIISLVGCVKPDKFAKNRFLLSDAPESISYSQSLKLVNFVHSDHTQFLYCLTPKRDKQFTPTSPTSLFLRNYPHCVNNTQNIKTKNRQK
jgi:hypothetical protein